MLTNFAEELKALRLSKDLTLKQIAVKTRIDYKFLEAMESGDFEFLPEIYVKAFLKDYLKALDADQTVYLKKYDSARHGKEFEVKGENVQAGENETKEQEDLKEHQPLSSFDAIRKFKRLEEEGTASKKRKTRIYYYVATSAVFVAAVLYLFFFSGEEELIVPEKSWEEVVGEPVAGGNSEDQTTSAADIGSADSLKLTIMASDTSWIRIMIDDSRTVEFLLFPQSQKSIKASDNYKILFGNSAVIKLDLNGRPLSLKSRSIVQRVLIDSNGVSELEQSSVKE